ncbi:hypothetical protein HYC85_029315 [Camellia sinensis]|uniref:Retrotransposon gag domain-containing protein n=1 Tax=Camellia sinensis TaxID=4442 RepID=A0A7J7G1K7_CAMSI|nr:hypothetical protein HYC85_029315 [Camellia sinensis]
MMAQNSEEIVDMTAALDQGITLQSETNIDMSHPPRSPVAHPVWAPQLYQAREPTTFELMGMIGDLQRSVTDLAYGMSASPPAAPYTGSFVPQEPPLLGRIVIELSQPEMASSYGNNMPTSTQILDRAEARGKDKVKADADPIEQLLWAVEALKAGGMNKQQISAVMPKTVEDAFPTPPEGSSSQSENRDGPRHARTVPPIPSPAPGKDQKAKVAPADPFACAASKSAQTPKYLPRGRRTFHALYMPLSKALQILSERGHLKPLEPRPLPKNLPTTHDAALYCAYHQQTGHATDNCFRLRHKVQDLIDNEVILPPTSAKSVTTQLLDLRTQILQVCNHEGEPPAGGIRLVPHYLRHERFVAFLKTFKNKCFTRPYEDLCGTALEIVQPRIALSLKIRPVCFEPRTHPEHSTVNCRRRPAWPVLKQPSSKRHQSQIKRVDLAGRSLWSNRDGCFYKSLQQPFS